MIARYCRSLTIEKRINLQGNGYTRLLNARAYSHFIRRVPTGLFPGSLCCASGRGMVGPLATSALSALTIALFDLRHR